ncbi:MAG: T9SS type A sorting domain-containing protein [Bacteroidetes bacterium]|nr:T9SS type A sorting domain-containing protein [Bacteroidota bacterium]
MTVAVKPPINNSAHLFTDSLLTDTVSWIHITGSLVADSAYQFLMIGNFFDDANTDTMMFDQDEGGYYYIDDVCVSTDSLFNQTWTSIPEVLINPQVNVFPNPFTSQLKICSTDIINELYVFDMLGNSISTMIGLNSRNVIYSANELGVTVNGIYLVSVQTSNGQKTYLKVFYLNQ